MCRIIQPMIFHSDALKMKEDSWNESVQAHDTHYVHFECQLGCIPHSVLLWAGLPFSCTSPDNSEVRITRFCSFLVPPFLSLKLVPVCCSKCVPISFTVWSCFQDLQSRLKVKSLREVRGCRVSGKDLSWPLLFLRTFSAFLSLPGHNYSLNLLEGPKLNHGWTCGPP